MTPDELAPVWQAYWDGDEDAHEVLVRQFLPLANYLARRALAKAPAHQDAEDIYSYAHHGLLDALTKFRPDGGAKFETYATRRIAGAIKDGQRKQDPLTRRSRNTVTVMRQAVEQLWIELGREPSIEEIAAASGQETDVVRHAILEQQTLNASLDLMAEQNDGGGSRTTEGDVELHAQLVEVGALLAQRLTYMPGRERAFTLLYYVDGRSMAEAADELGIGSDWCKRTRDNALASLRG